MWQGFDVYLITSAIRALITACGRGSWDEEKAD